MFVKLLKKITLFKNKILVLILTLSFLVNIFGLYPNYYLHQKEPNIWKMTDRIFSNIVHDFNFDPVFTSGPINLNENSTYYLSYGPWVYYLHVIIRGSVLVLIYFIHTLTNFSFGYHDVISPFGSFKTFINTQTFLNFLNLLTWTSRFTTSLFGTASVYLIYITSLKLFKKSNIAIFSSLSLALFPLFVRESHYITPDIYQCFFYILAFYKTSNILLKQSYKNYLIAGLLIGFATSIKYYPILLIPLIFFHLSKTGYSFMNRNLLISLFSFIAGFILGNPFILIHPTEIYKIYLFNMNFYSLGQFYFPNSILEKIAPRYFHFFHFKFLITDGVLLFPLVVSLIGFVYGLKKFRIITLIILTLILINIVFITFYVATIYDYLPLPALPFIAILIGLGCNFIIEKIYSYKKKFIGSILISSILFVLFVPSLIKDLQAGYACSQEINEYQLKEWISKNIPKGTNLAVTPDVQLKESWKGVSRSEISSDFSLLELQQSDVNYFIVSEGYLNRFTYWSTDFLNPPQELVNNQYPILVVSELNKKAIIVREFKKIKLCTNTRFTVYKLPQKETEVKSIYREYNFQNVQMVKDWELVNKGKIESEATVLFDPIGGSNKSGSLYYHFKKGALNKYRYLGKLFYTQPIYSPAVEATENRKYTVNGKVRQEKYPFDIVLDGFLRLDFYKSVEEKPLLSVISPRAKGYEFKKLSVTSIAPIGTKFLKIGFQGIGANDFGGFWVDDIQLLIDDEKKNI